MLAKILTFTAAFVLFSGPLAHAADGAAVYKEQLAGLNADEAKVELMRPSSPSVLRETIDACSRRFA